MTERRNLLITALLVIVFTIGNLINLNLGEGDQSIIHHLKGADFVYFHNGGSLVREGGLYYQNTFKNRLQTDYNSKGAQRGWRPVHPPLMFYFYEPLSRLPFLLSLNVTTILFVLIFSACILMLIRSEPVLRKHTAFIMLVMLAFPGISLGLNTGHPSALWCLLITAGYLLYKKNQPLAAGLVMGLLLAKPNYFLLTGAVFFLAAEWKVCAGMTAGAALAVLLSGLTDSYTLWKEWAPVFLTYQSFMEGDSQYHRQHSVKTFFSLIWHKGLAGKILSWAGVILGAATLALPGLYKRLSKGSFNPDRFWFAVPIVILLANPHLFDYDLPVMLVSYFLVIRTFFRFEMPPLRQFIIYLAGFGILGGISAISWLTRFQITVPAMLFTVLWALFRLPPAPQTALTTVNRWLNRLPFTKPRLKKV